MPSVRHAVAVLAAAALVAPVTAGGITRIIEVDPDTLGWSNAAGLTSLVSNGFASGEDSLRASGDGKNQFGLTGAAIFGGSPVTIGDIASISYSTKKSGGAGAADWFIQMYTDPYAGSGWYGNRVQAEPYLASNLEAPADQWNTFSTDAGTNQLNWGDSSNDDFGAALGAFDAFKATDVMGGSGTYADAGILYFTFGTGSGWADGFLGEIGPITIDFTDGTRTIIAMGSTPAVPGPAAAAALAGLGLVARRRRR